MQGIHCGFLWKGDLNYHFLSQLGCLLSNLQNREIFQSLQPSGWTF
jgi:hypothetical protein